MEEIKVTHVEETAFIDEIVSLASCYDSDFLQGCIKFYENRGYLTVNQQYSMLMSIVPAFKYFVYPYLVNEGLLGDSKVGYLNVAKKHTEHLGSWSQAELGHVSLRDIILNLNYEEYEFMEILRWDNYYRRMTGRTVGGALDYEENRKMLMRSDEDVED